MGEELLELDLSELDSVAGGRVMHQSELHSFTEMREKVHSLEDQMRREGREDEANALRERWRNGYLAWIKAIKNVPFSPEILPDIPLSDYFTLDGFEE